MKSLRLLVDGQRSQPMITKADRRPRVKRSPQPGSACGCTADEEDRQQRGGRGGFGAVACPSTRLLRCDIGCARLSGSVMACTLGRRRHRRAIRPRDAHARSRCRGMTGDGDCGNVFGSGSRRLRYRESHHPRGRDPRRDLGGRRGHEHPHVAGRDRVGGLTRDLPLHRGSRVLGARAGASSGGTCRPIALRTSRSIPAVREAAEVGEQFRFER